MFPSGLSHLAEARACGCQQVDIAEHRLGWQHRAFHRVQSTTHADARCQLWIRGCRREKQEESGFQLGLLVGVKSAMLSPIDHSIGKSIKVSPHLNIDLLLPE